VALICLARSPVTFGTVQSQRVTESLRQAQRARSLRARTDVTPALRAHLFAAPEALRRSYRPLEGEGGQNQRHPPFS